MKMQLFIVTCHQSPKGNEFQIIDVEWKKNLIKDIDIQNSQMSLTILLLRKP